MAHQDEMTECEDIVQGFLNHLSGERRYSTHTVRGYESDIRAYIRYSLRAGNAILTPSVRDLRGFLSEQMNARYSRKTINRRLSALRTFFRWLNASHMSESNAISAVQGPKIAQRLPSVLSARETEALFASLELEENEAAACRISDRQSFSKPHSTTNGQEQLPRKNELSVALTCRDAAIIELLYATGARVSEVAHLSLPQLDLTTGQVRLLGKGSKERVVIMHRRCVAAVSRYLHEVRPLLQEKKDGGVAGCADKDVSRADSATVFLSKTGRPLSTDSIRRIFKRHCLQAGLDPSFSPHAMRHTFATDLLNGGADLRSVQELLGHASLSTTQIYTHLTPDRLLKAHAQAHPRA